MGVDREAFEDLDDLDDLDDAGDCFCFVFDFERSFRGPSSRVFDRPRAADDERLPDVTTALRRAFFEGEASADDDRLDLAIEVGLVLDDAFDFGADGGETTLFFAFFFEDVVLTAAAVESDLCLPLRGFFPLIVLVAMVACWSCCCCYCVVVCLLVLMAKKMGPKEPLGRS